MNEPRVLKIELQRCEVEVLTEIMCVRGSSMPEAMRWLITRYRSLRDRNQYQREYMRGYRRRRKQ